MKKLVVLATVLMSSIALMTGCGSKEEEGNASAPVDENQKNEENLPDDNNQDEPNETDNKLSGNISTNGSTSMEKVISVLIEAFKEENPDVTITYDATGSGAGITAASEGTADIGLSSRDLKEEETGLDGTVIALDGIAIIVNPGNEIGDLSVEQIGELFSGKIENWKEVGGADAPVAVIGREAGSGTRDGFESIVGVSDECAYDQELTSTGAVITAVASNEYAIGYASLSAVSDETKTLTVDGVTCSEESVLDGTYAIQRPFVLVTSSESELSDATKAFIEYALSDETTDLISEAGVVQAK